MVQNDPPALFARLRGIPAAIVSDTLAAMGLPNQVLSYRLRPIVVTVPFAGPAVCFAGADGDDPTASTRAYETDRKISSGCVVVIHTGSHRTGAVVGGNTITSWRMRGCTALVTDGLIRDSVDFAGFAVYAAGCTPLNNRGRWSYRSVDVEIALPGQSTTHVVVCPGDVILGDVDGVVVIPREHAQQVAADAAIVADVERRMRHQIIDGRDREMVYDENDRFSHVGRIPGSC